MADKAAAGHKLQQKQRSEVKEQQQLQVMFSFTGVTLHCVSLQP